MHSNGAFSVFALMALQLTIVRCSEKRIDTSNHFTNDCYAREMIKQLMQKKPKELMWLVDGSNYQFTWRSVMLQLRNCTTFHGDLLIDHKSLKRNNPDGAEYIRIEDLDSLKNLRVINGNVKLYLPYFPQIKNLSFLSNLEQINGDYFYLFNSHIETLNLKRVNFNVTNLSFKKNLKLCYLEYFETNLKSSVFVTIFGNKKEAECRSEGKTCDSSCAPKSGCLGPGNERCAKCRDVLAGFQCVAHCQVLRGFYQRGEQRQCSRCHPQCRWSCDGSGPHQCHGCKVAKDDNICVSHCPDNKYLDKKDEVCKTCTEMQFLTVNNVTGDRECRPCHNFCRAGCYGESEHDCLPCLGVKVIVNATEWLCRDSCPEGFHEMEGVCTERQNVLEIIIPVISLLLLIIAITVLLYCRWRYPEKFGCWRRTIHFQMPSGKSSDSKDIEMKSRSYKNGTSTSVSSGMDDADQAFIASRLFLVASTDFPKLNKKKISVPMEENATFHEMNCAILTKLYAIYPKLKNEEKNFVIFSLSVTHWYGEKLFELSEDWIDIKGNRFNIDEGDEDIDRGTICKEEDFMKILEVTKLKDRIVLDVSKRGHRVTV